MVLALMLTRQCNFHCRHCMVDSIYSDSLAEPEVIEKFIKLCQSWKPEQVYLIGGEVLLKYEAVKYIVDSARDFTEEIIIFSNGSFLMSKEKVRKVEELNITVRISDDRFHREFWTDELKEKIESSKYWVVSKDNSEDMIPVGRAYNEFKHLKYNMGCSLITGVYDTRYPNGHRCMVMMNGDVNLYCATVEAALANVYEDSDITYDLLVQREKILHNYLAQNILNDVEDTYMAKLCNECPHYKVTNDAIYYKGKQVALTENYEKGFVDLYEKFHEQQ